MSQTHQPPAGSDRHSSLSTHPMDGVLTAQKTEILSLPKIERRVVAISISSTEKNEQEDWALVFYNDWAELFKDGAPLVEEIKSFVGSFLLCAKREKNQPIDFRAPYTFQATPFLLGLFFSKKEVRFYSPRLSNELFLLQALNPVLLSTTDRALFHDLEKSAEMVAGLRPSESPSVWESITSEYQLPDLNNDLRYRQCEVEAENITKELLTQIRKYRPGLFERMTDYGLGLTAQYDLLRVHLLKFLAILPSLDHDKTGQEVKRVLLESLRRLLFDNKKVQVLKNKVQVQPIPTWMSGSFEFLAFMAKLCPSLWLAQSVRSLVKIMAKRFIAGESIEKAGQSLMTLGRTGRDATLDQLGELVVSEKEADRYFREVLQLIKGWSIHVKKGERNAAGINRAHVSIKVSALCSDFRPLAFEATYQKIAPRLREILITAKSEDVFINIDAEHYHFRDLVFEIYKKVLLETSELHDYADTGIVVQAYLRDAHLHLRHIIDLAKQRKLCMPVRLVKGAYWDAETVEANAHGFVAPEFLNKEETDLHYRQLIVLIFDAFPQLQLCLAGHNFADHAYAVALKNRYYSKLPPIEHQCLHMTYEALSSAMAEMGWAVRNYIPVGGLLVGMGYLVRRIMENSSQVGVLTIMRSHKKQGTVSPGQMHIDKKKLGRLQRDEGQAHLSASFFNVAPVRNYIAAERQCIETAYQSFTPQLGAKYPNAFSLSGTWNKVLSPSDGQTIVGEIQRATQRDVEKAVFELDACYGQGDWARALPIYRASALLRAAMIMLAERMPLSALISYESGKTAMEALGDVDEAIDFLNFYAREEVRLQKGSRPHSEIHSRGVVAVISPWNFPLAIPCGMVSAALVAGNTVALKSAEQTPLIAQKLIDILHRAGVPHNVLIHLPGPGGEVGNALVEHPRVSGIVFTGSKAVGTMIAQKAQKRLVRNLLYEVDLPVKVITEMGGKNAVLVTANAELDETVAGILSSAFGHAGQKCSALSRVLVDQTIKDKLVARLKEAAMDLQIGPATTFSTSMNPVISLKDQKRLRSQMQELMTEATQNGGQVVVDRSQEELPGYCVGPVIVEVPANLSQNLDSYCHRELFGPVIHVIACKNLDHGLELLNSSEYALTAGIFSQSQDDVDYCIQRMQAGNIYVNRGITGARVAIEPFGGFKMSGTGPKAGGRDYLKAFHSHLVNLPLQKDLQRKTPEVEDGADYLFTLARRSDFSVENRQWRLDRALDLLIRDFEGLYQGIYGENKVILKKMSKWCRTQLNLFQNEGSSNRKIPGQLSYNDYQLSSDHFVVVALEERAYFSTLLQVVGAIAVGTGVTVLARNQKSYTWWKNVQSHFLNAGFPTENFDVFFSNELRMREALQLPTLELIAIDGPLEVWQNIAQELFSSDRGDDKVVKKVWTPFDAPDINDLKQYVLPFIHVRSCAVNTMRHGAPLDLGL